MLSESEHSSVVQSRIRGLGAYIFCAVMDHETWSNSNCSDQQPPKTLLQTIYDEMDKWKTESDIQYLHDRTDLSALQSEKEAWSLLSDRISSFLNRLNAFLAQVETTLQASIQLCSEFWELLQEWIIISNAYKKKYDRSYEDVPQTQHDLQSLIKRLRTAANTACAAHDGSSLDQTGCRHPSPKSPNG